MLLVSGMCGASPPARSCGLGAALAAARHRRPPRRRPGGRDPRRGPPPGARRRSAAGVASTLSTSEALPGPLVYWAATRVGRRRCRRRRRAWCCGCGERVGTEAGSASASRPGPGSPRPVTSPRSSCSAPSRRAGSCSGGSTASSSPPRTAEPPRGHAGTRRRASFRQGDRGSVAVIGPSRSGKTVNVIAGLLDWDGPAVVVSVKRDLIDATRSARSADRRDPSVRPLRRVRACPPAGSPGGPRCGRRRRPVGRRRRPRALAASIPRSGVDGGADYWVKQAEILLTGLLGAAALDPEPHDGRRRRVGVHQVDPGQGATRTRSSTSSEIAKDNGTPSEREAAAAAMLQLDAVWNLDERVRSSVYATVQTVVQAWLDPAVEASADARRAPASTFVDLDWLVDPDTVEHAVPRRSARRPEAARPRARRAARRPQGSGLPSATSPASGSAGRC